ncbi:hypothetical protein M413DRAFT_442077 [Hebeloma cylindrosporum]|uniref:J domain-containing protein n=1 Tax=Hebeloma cylindrosporum TaxID=76867 RepID=A0A0C3CMQ5_HEBCY|nr:hypothetical protein M413DRAFT_442077 [Hebeloma cylindrosporum h7]
MLACRNPSPSVYRWLLASPCHNLPNRPRRFLQSASKTKQDHNPFPYPTHRNPTPHQLFHLPHNATEADIKARYYDLVRLYHPDKVGASSTPDVAQARFQAISAAYDVLRGKTPLNESGLGSRASNSASTSYQTTAAYRAMRRRRQELYDTGAVDDGRKDAWIIFGVVMTIVIVIAQTMTTRKAVLSEALSQGRYAHMSSRNNHRPTADARLSQESPEIPKS